MFAYESQLGDGLAFEKLPFGAQFCQENMLTATRNSRRRNSLQKSGSSGQFSIKRAKIGHRS